MYKNFGIKQGNLKKRVEVCKNCGKHHWGVCWKGRGGCYKCGQEGYVSPNCPNLRNDRCYSCGALDHQTQNCPKKGIDRRSGSKKNHGDKLTITGSTQLNRSTTSTFSMTIQGEVASRDVVSGINQIDKCIRTVNSSTTYSFVTCDFACRLKVTPRKIENILRI